MTVRRSLAAFSLCVTAALTLTFGQQQIGHWGNRWKEYEPEMQHPADDPPGAWIDAEFMFGRLRFRSYRDNFSRGHMRWGTDANKSDRTFIQGLRRLSRVEARSVEQILDVDSDEMFSYPFMYAVGVGDWTISDSHAARLREYFARGGFLVVDDFHNEREWAAFMDGVRRIMPEGRVIDIEDDNPIFHTVFDTSHPFRVPGLNVVYGSEIERGGIVPAWRGILDDQGRIVIAALFNQDYGDAWEWADLPEYPERFATQAFHVGVNYVVYAMTH
jgi:hypothetical protein